MFDALLRASIGGGILAGIVWALGRLLPRLSPAARAALWWLAAAKFLFALAWVPPLQLPVLPQADGASGAGLRTSGVIPARDLELTVRSSARAADVLAPARGQNGSPEAGGQIRHAMLLIWATGAGIALGLASHRYRRTRRLVADASPAPPEVVELAAGLAARLGVKRTPGVRISHAIDTPLVAGLMHAVVVLPAARLSRLDVDRQRMVLCHELAHVKRRDLALGCIPALAERLFFFHPLAHLAAREFALWREAACDQTVLKVLGAEPQDYGRLLLDLGVSRPRMGLAAAGAPWSFQNLKRRLVMLGNPSSSSLTTRLLTGAVLAVSVLALVPVQLVGRAAPPAPSSPDSPSVVAQAAVATATAPAAVPVARSRNGAQDPPAVLTPSPDGAQDQPAVLTPSPAKGWGYRSGTVNGDTFVLLVDDEGATWHVSGRDHTRVRSLQRDGEPLLWFRRGGQEYLVRDRNVVEQARAIWKPVNELGGEMGELGGRMGALGAGQGKHGAEMGALGAKQGELGSRVGELAVRQAALGLKGTRGLTDQERELADRERRETEAELEKLEQQMEALGEQMKALAKPMEDLEKQMEPLSQQMEELGRRMEEASKRAESDMETLIERSIQDGTAQKVK